MEALEDYYSRTRPAYTEYLLGAAEDDDRKYSISTRVINYLTLEYRGLVFKCGEREPKRTKSPSSWIETSAGNVGFPGDPDRPVFARIMFIFQHMFDKVTETLLGISVIAQEKVTYNVDGNTYRLHMINFNPQGFGWPITSNLRLLRANHITCPISFLARADGSGHYFVIRSGLK